MKEKIIRTSVLTALLSASSLALAGGPEVILPEPNYFDGLYIGGFGGVAHDSFEGSSDVVLTEPVAIFNIVPLTVFEAGNLNHSDFSSGDFNGYGGVKGGFGKQMRQLYLGVEGWGEFGSSSDTETQSAQIPFNTNIPVRLRPSKQRLFLNPQASATTATTMKIQDSAGVGGRVGWLATPRTLVYAKIGASWADIKVYNSLNVNASNNITDKNGNTVINVATNLSTGTTSASAVKAGLDLGAGVEQMVVDNVSVDVEYNYVNYGAVHTSPAQLTGGTTIETNSKWGSFNRFIPLTTNVFTEGSVNSVHVSTLMAGLNFYFSNYVGL